MPLDRDHAFADGQAYPKPKQWRLWRWTWSRRGTQERARSAWARFEQQAQVARGCLLGPNAWCVNSSGDSQLIRLGEQVICRGLLRIEKFGKGRIIVGRNTYIGDDCLISSSAGVEIGEHVLIAHGVQIFDNDSHPLDARERVGDYASVLSHGEREAIASAPISIGHRAWIGFGAILLKGCSVGENSVVAAGSVVTGNVPPNTVVAGNPARIVKTLDDVPA